jgi:hypothetical protein
MKLYKDKLYLWLSLAAALASFVLFNITKAPTVSFWDCGEFIATSFIMGIPHPPGNPLFVIIGRLFTMLPIAAELAVRVNLISVFSSAASVFVAFWLILRLAIGNREKMPEGPSKISLGIGAFAGSLIMGFSNTFWSNAVEAEVYGLAMLLMLVITYLAILWSQNTEKPENDRLLLLISYLLWVSLGIHLTTFIITIPLVLYLAYIDYLKNGFERWPVWSLMMLFVLYAVPIQTQILSIFGINISAYEMDSFFLIMALAFLASLALFFIKRKKLSEGARIWGLTLAIFAFGALGYSNQIYIPLRAAEKPAINEDDPSNWPRFKSFLERKQYGQESMVTRMFSRRATWENQFISHPDFGLFRLLTKQFASPDAKLTLYSKNPVGDEPGVDFSLNLWILFVVILGIAGIMEAVKRSPPEGMFILFAMLLCTVGLVFYLNFSDGSKAIAPLAEVRARDYFYTPGFMLYAILIGVGLASILEWLGEWANKSLGRGGLWRKALFPIGLFAAVLLPVHTCIANFANNDRQGNYLPWDYASNILQSCAKDAIVFTNGDNDTFPLWFIQQVDKVRTDVRVVNLSLLNTPWYIHQIKDQMHVPINLTYDEIENLHPMRAEDSKSIWRVQDQMVREIIVNSQANGWNPPVYFSTTVASDNRLGLEPHFILEGMAYRIVDSTGKDRTDRGVSQRIFGNPGHFRGLLDPRVHKDDNDSRIVANYISAMFRLVTDYQGAGQADSALAIAELAVRLRSSEAMWQATAYLAKMYVVVGRMDKVDSLLNAGNKDEGERISLAVAQDFLASKLYDQAEKVLKLALSKYPSSFTALNNLAMIYYQKGDSASANALISQFSRINGKDQSLMKAVDDMSRRIKDSSSQTPETK